MKLHCALEGFKFMQSTKNTDVRASIEQKEEPSRMWQHGLN